MKKKIKIGVSGDIGSFSEEAGLLYAKNQAIAADFSYLIDMQSVLSAIDAGKIDMGIFPVVNKRGGLVKMAFDAMGNYLFRMIDELWLDVRQCLMVNKGVKLTDIKNIVSHPQALAQCKTYLKTNFNNVELIPSQDTALSARELAEGKLSQTNAVIAPLRAAEVYGLDMIAANIQDDQPNLTAFIIVVAR